VPHNLIQEVAVEVPQVQVHEILTQVPSAMAEQRVVQTGIEFERSVRREDVVMRTGQVQYSGIYQAPIVQVDQPRRVQATWVATEPVAAVGVDVNGDGRADYMAVGADLNNDGIPDWMQQQQRGMCVAGAVPMATAAVDVNKDGRADYIVSGVDMNQDGIPDVLQAPQYGAMSMAAGQTRAYVAGGVAQTQVPMATAAYDFNRDGRMDMYVTGPDLNHDGIPDVMQQGGAQFIQGRVAQASMATVGLDVNGDGRADFNVTGVDLNHDGIPDALQQPMGQPLRY